MPMLKIEPLPFRDVFEDMARVALEHRPTTRAGDVIKITVGVKYVRTIARGAPKNNKDSLFIDLRTREALGLTLHEIVDVKIEKSGFLGAILWAWNASNAMPRVAARLAVLSVALGALGALLGIISLWR